MINVAHLFSPQHAVKAVQAFKGYRWTQLEYTEFLRRVASYQAVPSSGPGHKRPVSQKSERGASRSVRQLSPDTLKALFKFLPQVTNPLLRRVCLDTLQGLGTTDARHVCCAAFLETESYEEACHYIDPESDTSNLLISFGGADQILDASQAKPVSNSLWSRLFEAYVVEENYEKAKWLWMSPERPSHKAVGEPILLKFVELIGRYKDKPVLQQFLKTSSESGELTLTSGAVAACLNCFTDDPQLWKIIQYNDHVLTPILILQDGRFISDALVAQVMPLLEQFRAESLEISPLLGNLLLQGIYRNNTSRVVLHTYRILVDEFRLMPNVDTAQILANSAYRLGNSKLLGYEIWKEMAAKVPPHRKFYETMLMCQLVGSGYNSALFFVGEMFRNSLPLRSHVQRLLFNKFERLGASAQLLALFQQRRPERLHTRFDTSQAETESESLGLQQSKANAETFLHGQNPGEDALIELQNMLAFDKRKAASPRHTEIIY